MDMSLLFQKPGPMRTQAQQIEDGLKLLSLHKMFVEQKPGAKAKASKKKNIEKNEIQAIDDMVFSDHSDEEEKAPCTLMPPESAFVNLSLQQQTTSCDSSGNRVDDIQHQKSQGLLIFDTQHVKARGNTIGEKTADDHPSPNDSF